MNNTILATKLYIPPAPSNVVLRSRLIQKLNEGLSRGLTLISAPAGFGKTTLMSEWLASIHLNSDPKPGESSFRAAWLSLDEADNDLPRFLTYLIAALQSAAPRKTAGNDSSEDEIGARVLEMLQSSQSLPIEPILTALINELATVPDPIILILDDYHVIDAKSIDEGVSFFIEHMPPNLHMVIATREDPQLPLSRLRARNQMMELRAGDLRFTPAEAAGFLQTMGFSLSPEDVMALETRTEGWIAGLQLAALAMQSLGQQEYLAEKSTSAPKYHQDISRFIRTFAGDHRYIMDYLVEEVLQRQSESVRSFLLQTSILDRLYGPLCSAVTGQADGSAQLQALERGNFFVVPLDDQRRWYRYHHLFADVLLAYLRAEQPDQVAALHRRASVWYEQNGSLPDAIQHALAGEDFARAADLIERAFPEITRSRQELILLGWLNALPKALIRDRPVLCNLYAGVLLQTGQMEGVEGWLRAAERWLTPTAGEREQRIVPPSTMAVVNQEEFRRLPGAVAMHRAGQALMLDKVDEAIQHARRVLDIAPEDDFLRRGGAAALQGLVYWTKGDLEAARQIYPESIVYLQRAGYLADSLGCALALADIVIAQGRLHEARGIYEQALQFASEHGEPHLRGTADMLVGMSDLFYEQNDLPAATLCLDRAKEQGEHTGLPQNRYRSRVAMARIQAAEGDLKGALDLLDEAQRLYIGDFSPNVRPISAMKARVWAAQGRLEEAFHWAHEQKLTPTDDLTYLHEFEHITLSRILLARYQRDLANHFAHEAEALLERLLKGADAGGRVRSVIEIRILQALILHAQDDVPAALASLQQALALAEPVGYIRIFVDEGSPMEQLLRDAWVHEINLGYTGKLLSAFKTDHPRGREEEIPHGTARAVLVPVTAEAQAAKSMLAEPEPPIEAAPQVEAAPLLEALSQRELDVLRLFRTELSGPEIAQELMVALSTVRTHTKSIYSKLNVSSRRAAVRRAEELKLI